MVYKNMTKTYVLILFAVVFFSKSYPSYLQLSALTFEPNSGRFGDNITNYIKAKWMAHKYGIPFYFSHFPNSHLLQAYTREELLTPIIKKKYKKKVVLRSEQDIQGIAEPVLFQVEAKTMMLLNNGKEANAFKDFSYDLFIKINNDPLFFNNIRLMLQPSKKIQTLVLPSNRITVAVHVRKGSGSDGPLFSQQIFDGSFNEKMPKSGIAYADKQSPKKFPPEQYYLDQLKKLSEMVDHQPLYVCLFTDDKNPDQLLERFRNILGLHNIIIALGTVKKNTSVVDDLYHMAQFDCLIRPDSAFSYCSQLIGQHKIILYPQTACWEGNRLIIDRVCVIQR